MRPPRSSAAALVLILALAVGAPAAPPASARAPGEALSTQFLAEMNGERAARGVAAVGWDEALAAEATAWADELARSGSFGHSSANRVEIIGAGPTTASITRAWMASPAHRVIVLDPNLSGVGVGVACGSDGQIRVVAQFHQNVVGRRSPARSSLPVVTPEAGGASCAAPGGAGDAAALVQRLYAAFLHRPPDPAGMATFNALALAGHSAASIGSLLARSPEFLARYASVPDSEFVAVAYRDVLDREADPGGWRTHEELRRSGGRGAVLLSLASSAELQARIAGW